jgi:hypothetical protein
MPLEPLAGEGEQLRSGRQIVIGSSGVRVLDMRVIWKLALVIPAWTVLAGV